MTRILAVAGTWAYDGQVTPDEWNHHDSAWFRYMRGFGFSAHDPDEPFVWDGSADGVGWGIRAKSKHLIWRAAADNLAYRLRRMPFADRNVVAHSHGGAVAAYAACLVPVRRLVTVAMPVREDMEGVYRLVAKTPDGAWRHTYAIGWSDSMQLLGSLFDGSIGVQRKVLLPGVVNIGIPGNVGHSKVLNSPDAFHWWAETGLTAFLAGEGVAA